MLPLERESRFAAQLAPLVTFELMPYFLKNPFSCAITIGEQSVSAIMPKLRYFTSGPSLLEAPGATDLDSALESHPASAPPSSAVPARAVALSIRRRVMFNVTFISFSYAM